LVFVGVGAALEGAVAGDAGDAAAATVAGAGSMLWAVQPTQPPLSGSELALVGAALALSGVGVTDVGAVEGDVAGAGSWL